MHLKTPTIRSSLAVRFSITNRWEPAPALGADARANANLFEPDRIEPLQFVPALVAVNMDPIVLIPLLGSVGVPRFRDPAEQKRSASSAFAPAPRAQLRHQHIPLNRLGPVDEFLDDQYEGGAIDKR
tara:strand:+ start:17409 stop:17789 length:381 start_codon:yes stop_codon:yes gene_type:complete